jgi:hypothetical protein
MSDDNSEVRPTGMHATCHTAPAPSRRRLLAAGAGFGGGAMTPLFASGAVTAGASATLERLKRAERDSAHRVLLKGGAVLSLDPQVGDFANGDVLIEGKKILAIGENAAQNGFVLVMVGIDKARHDDHPGGVHHDSRRIQISPDGKDLLSLDQHIAVREIANLWIEAQHCAAFQENAMSRIALGAF